MKHKRILALAIALALSVSAVTITAFANSADGTNSEKTVAAAEGTERQEKRCKKEKVAEPDNAVGKDAAKAAALKDAGLTADKVEKIKSRVSKTEDGTVIYKVHFTANGTWYSYKVDALTGKVLDKTTQSAEEHEASKPQSRQGKKEKVAEPENAVGKDAAKAAALKDAGLTADKVEKIKSRVAKTEDGTVIYKVHFTANGTWYSYKIDALTGKVLDKTTQSAEEHEASKPQGRHGKKTKAAESENKSGEDAAAESSKA